MIKHAFGVYQTRGETNSLPSKTQPDDTLSVREILARYSRGIPMHGPTNFYDEPEGEDYSDFDQLDRLDKIQYIKDNEAHIKELKRRSDIEKRDAQPVNSSGPKDQEPAEGGKPPESGSPQPQNPTAHSQTPQ